MDYGQDVYINGQTMLPSRGKSKEETKYEKK